MSEKIECNGRLRLWIAGAEGRLVMVDLNEVVTLTATPQPGVVRHLPGGRTETTLPMMEVTMRLRSGQQERITMGQGPYETMITTMGYEVPK